jgi:hypothetical protein
MSIQTPIHELTRGCYKGQSFRNVKMTDHSHLNPRLRIRRAMSLFSSYDHVVRWDKFLLQ